MNYPTVSMLLVMGLLSGGREAPCATDTRAADRCGDHWAGALRADPHFLPARRIPPKSASCWPNAATSACPRIRPIRVAGTLSCVSRASLRSIATSSRIRLFVLAGGPGMAATTFYASAAFSFERIHRDRDIVLVDQRGTGQSNPLNCALDDDALYRASDAEVAADARRCLTTLEKTAHVEFYTTSVAVRDLDTVRAALGYARINLYGVSYGTRVAQHYVRRYPSQTRAVILDGVVPPTACTRPCNRTQRRASAEGIYWRAAPTMLSAASTSAIPSVSYHSLRDSLQAHAVPVSLPDPTSGESCRSSNSPATTWQLSCVLRVTQQSRRHFCR